MNKYIIVGLGNPGSKYDFTKHNVGFDILDLVVNKTIVEKSIIRTSENIDNFINDCSFEYLQNKNNSLKG